MFTLTILSEGSATMTEWIGIASLLIEILAVAIIVGSFSIAPPGFSIS